MSSLINQFLQLTTLGAVILLLIGCNNKNTSDPNYVARVVTQRLDDEIVGYSLSTKYSTDVGFTISTKEIDANRKCIMSMHEDVYKVENGILYKLDTIQNVAHWLPYLLLSQGKCIVSPLIDHFGSLSVTNCTLSIDTDSIVYQTQVRRVNGNIEKEEIIVLNRDYLSIKRTELSSDTELLLSSIEVNQELGLLELQSKCHSPAQ